MDDRKEPSTAPPEEWRARLTAALRGDERPLSWFEGDLDGQLRFALGLVVLTETRFISLDADGAVRSWNLEEIASLRAREKSGLGTLDLAGPEARLACWRYTAGRAAPAHRLVDRFDVFRLDGLAEAAPRAESTCPSCGSPLPADMEQCPTCVPPPTPPAASSLLRLLRFARPRLGMISLGFGLTLASTAAGMIPPYLTIPLTDLMVAHETFRHDSAHAPDLSIIPWYLAAMAAAAVLAWLLGWARTFVIAWVSERVAADLRNETYAHLHRLSLEFFGGKRTGDLMSRLGSDTDRICNFLSINLLDFLTDVLMIAMTAAILAWYDIPLTLAAFLPFPIIVWLVHRVRDRLKRGFQSGNRAWAEMTSVLADTIPGIRVVKAFAQENREVRRFRTSNDRVLAANDRVNSVWSFFGPLITLMTQAGLLFVWGFGIWRVTNDRITVGVLTGFLAYISRFYTRLEAMSRMVQATQRAATSAQRLFEILDRVPSVAEPTRPVHPGHLAGKIELRHVGFRYGNRPVVHDLNLTIEPGEMIGLVGPSGAGKSTLVNLVCRFYDVGEGEIKVDGVDVRQYPVTEYRRHIGLVLQEPFLFYGTIAENISYGRPDATRAEIVAAARAARAHEFILRLPEGYDSLVGERGMGLSGGERQRVSIARALLIDPRILILDEATSAVDTETEREIQEALDNLIRGRTTIAIAHRLSTLRKADRLVVLERGRIAEVGHHHELLQDPSGAYTRLHRAQAELAGTQ